MVFAPAERICADRQAQAGRPAFTQAVIRDILLGKKHLPPLGPVLVLNPGYHGFAVREERLSTKQCRERGKGTGTQSPSLGSIAWPSLPSPCRRKSGTP